MINFVKASLYIYLVVLRIKQRVRPLLIRICWVQERFVRGHQCKGLVVFEWAACMWCCYWESRSLIVPVVVVCSQESIWIVGRFIGLYSKNLKIALSVGAYVSNMSLQSKYSQTKLIFLNLFLIWFGILRRHRKM